jgi:hypothetical protein
MPAAAAHRGLFLLCPYVPWCRGPQVHPGAFPLSCSRHLDVGPAGARRARAQGTQPSALGPHQPRRPLVPVASPSRRARAKPRFPILPTPAAGRAHGTAVHDAVAARFGPVPETGWPARFELWRGRPGRVGPRGRWRPLQPWHFACWQRMRRRCSIGDVILVGLWCWETAIPCRNCFLGLFGHVTTSPFAVSSHHWFV